MYNTDYLKMSHLRAQEQRKEFVMHENVQIYIKDQMPEGIDISSILDKINLSIPQHLTSEIDSIYIGMFAEF